MGVWNDSPLGPMSDVMWARPDGERVLLVGRPEVGEFISAVYRFDRVEHRPLSCRFEGPSGPLSGRQGPSGPLSGSSTLLVSAGDLEITLRGGRNWRIPLARVRSLAAFRRVEAVTARRLLGVRTFGTSPTGIFEWYRADRYQRVVDARARLDGADLGSLCRFRTPTGFGFSEPPQRPSVVRVRPLLVDPTGDLATVLARAVGPRE